MKNIYLLSLLSAFLLSGCVISKPSGFSAESSKISSTTWILQDEDGDALSYNNEAINMSFESGDGDLRVSGFAGCNRYFGNANMQPGIIQFQNIASTKMACPEMEMEDNFLSLLQRVDTYSVSNNELNLYQGKMLLLTFRAK